MKQSAAPASLIESGIKALADRVQAFADALLPHSLFLPQVNVRLSGRAVAAPGSDLPIDCLGLPETMAWGLFGPLLQGVSEEATVQRTAEATRLLDEQMAHSVVLVNRQPSEHTTSFIALRPVRVASDTLRLPPLLCNYLEADFDGDQIAVFLPVSEEAQEEAQDLFSVLGHLRRDPSRLLAPYNGLVPGHGFLYGLAERSRNDTGRAEIAALFGRELPSGLLDRATLNAMILAYQREHGIETTVSFIQQLADYAFAATKQSGASIGAYPDTRLPERPTDTTAIAAWDTWGMAVEERLNSLARQQAFDGPELGTALLSAASGARGRTLFLAKMLASVSPGSQMGLHGVPIAMTNGWRDGLPPTQLQVVAMNTRYALHRILGGEANSNKGYSALRPEGKGVLAQAMRSRLPGVAFAEAAASGETDFLVDSESRLF